MTKALRPTGASQRAMREFMSPGGMRKIHKVVYVKNYHHKPVFSPPAILGACSSWLPRHRHYTFRNHKSGELFIPRPTFENDMVVMCVRSSIQTVNGINFKRVQSYKRI